MSLAPDDSAAIDQWPEGVAVHREGVVIHVNPALLRGLGWDSLEDLSSRRLAEFFGGIDGATIEAAGPPGLFGPRGDERDVQLLRKDAAPITVRATTWQRPFEGEPALITVVREIPAWQVDRRLQSNLLQVMETMPGNVALSRDDVLVYVNASSALLLGYRPEELLGKRTSELVHPDDREASDRRTRSRMDHGEPAVPIERRLQRRDGTYGTFEITGFPMEFEGQSAAFLMLHDVTARQKSLTFLRALVDACPLATYTLDLDLNVTDWNPAAETIFGWTKQEVLALGMNPTLLDEERRVIPGIRQRLIEGERVIWFESRRLRKDGQIIDVSISVAGMRDETRRAIGFVLMIADISDRKRADAALRNSTELIRAVVDASPLATYSVDLSHRITQWNPAAETMLGWTQEEALLMRDTDSIPEEQSATIPGIRRRLLAGERVIDRESKRIHKDGHVLDVRISVATTHDARNEPTGFVVLIADITERKRAERALHESTEIMRALFQSSPQALIALDRAAQVRMWNPAAERIFGWRFDEVVGKQILGLGQEEGEARAIFERMLRGESLEETERLRMQPFARILVALTSESQRQDETVALHRSGRSIDLVVSGAVLRDAAGDVTGMMTIASDVTERNRQRAEANALQAELRRTESMTALGALLAGVAHEARNPLFAMTATIDALQSRWGAREELNPYLKMLRGEAARLNQLMSDSLELGRPSTSVLEVGPLTPVIDGAVRACQALAAEAGVSVVAVSRAFGTPISMAPDRVLQVFQNLIQNGIQHSSRGHTVRIEAAVEEEGTHNWLVCSVVDTGPGFIVDDLPHVMEPFFSRRRGGTGLGLSIVQRIVEQHGGRITAGNRPGGGAIVSVRFPISDAMPVHTPGAVAS